LSFRTQSYEMSDIISEAEMALSYGYKAWRQIYDSHYCENDYVAIHCC
jgi:hypothetical protein